MEDVNVWFIDKVVLLPTPKPDVIETSLNAGIIGMVPSLERLRLTLKGPAAIFPALVTFSFIWIFLVSS